MAAAIEQEMSFLVELVRRLLSYEAESRGVRDRDMKPTQFGYGPQGSGWDSNKKTKVHRSCCWFHESPERSRGCT